MRVLGLRVDHIHARMAGLWTLRFDEETIGAIAGVFEKYLEEAIERKIILSYTITMPSLDDFTSAVKSSGDMTLSKVFTATGRFEAHTFTITGSITV